MQIMWLPLLNHFLLSIQYFLQTGLCMLEYIYNPTTHVSTWLLSIVDAYHFYPD